MDSDVSLPAIAWKMTLLGLNQRMFISVTLPAIAGKLTVFQFLNFLILIGDLTISVTLTAITGKVTVGFLLS